MSEQADMITYMVNWNVQNKSTLSCFVQFVEFQQKKSTLELIKGAIHLHSAYGYLICVFSLFLVILPM
jgi:hypothetical protein